MEIDKEVHDTLEGEVQYLRKEYAYLHRRFLDIEEKLEDANRRLSNENDHEDEIEWTGSNETEDRLLRRIKAMFVNQEKLERLGCMDLRRLREDVLFLVHGFLIRGR